MSNRMDNIIILYVEDEEDVREGYARALRRVSKNLILAEDGQIGLEKFIEHSPHIVISDIKMPRMNGIEMVKAIKKLNTEVSIIFTSAHSESAYLLEAIELQVEGYLLKPVEKNSLITLIRKLSKNILLQKENEMQKEILQHIMDAESSISVVTDGNEISYASKSFLNLFNVGSVKEFQEHFTSILKLLSSNKNFTSDHSDKDINLYNYIQNSDENSRVIILEDANKTEKSFFISISKITENNFLINFTDITQIEKERVITNKKAYRDNLTQIYNRNKFEEVFEYQIKQVKRYNTPLTLAILDIDYFKKFNDKYGHLVGDEILVLLSKTILHNIRESDLFARWGGEEFVILFNNANLENSSRLSLKFKNDIQNIQHHTGETITASFGLTQYKDGDTIKTMLQRADTALYNAKSSGRNRVETIV